MTVLSRKFILDWLRGLGIEIDKIEDIGKGDALCALLKRLDPHFPPYKKNPANTGEYLANLRLAQAYFTRNNIKNYFPIDKMANLKMQDNLEVIQWFYKYWEKEEHMKKQANEIAGLSINDTSAHINKDNVSSNKDGMPSNKSEDTHVKADAAKEPLKYSGKSMNSATDKIEDLDQSFYSKKESQETRPEMADGDYEGKIKALQESEREKNEKIEALKNYVKISYSETKFYFEKLERIENILTSKDLEFSNDVKQKILDILYEDN